MTNPVINIPAFPAPIRNRMATNNANESAHASATLAANVRTNDISNVFFRPILKAWFM